MLHRNNVTSKMENLDNTFIFDYETLGQKTESCPVLCVSYMSLDRLRFFKNPYTLKELYSKVRYLKFDVDEQIRKYGKKPEKESVEWWNKLIDKNKELENLVLKRKSSDISINQFFNILKKEINFKKINQVFTRSPVFDFHLTYTLAMHANQKVPWNFWHERDIRSFLEGMLFPNNEYEHDFIPEIVQQKPVLMKMKHHPSFDIILDALRLQETFRSYIE